MAVKYLDNAGTQYLVNKIKAIDGKIPTESQITTMITTALNTYKEGIVTIVESLPQTGEEGKLYLMVDPSDSDVYIIYTWEDNAFKRMGSKTFTLTVDSALSATSTNPVQNKVIKSALDGKANSSHTHGSITNDGKLGTASRVVITGTDKKIGISTVTTTQLGYLSGVTSAIQTQLDGKSATGHTHTAGDVAGLATVATTGSYNDLSNKPTINDSTITIQKNGSTVDSFTTNGSNKTINITVPTKTSDLTNDSGFLTSTDISSKANDSEVLHKAQTETVTGEKTFKKDVKIIDLNANERPGVKFEVNGTFRTFEDAKDALPDTDFGDFGVGTVWSAFWLDDNTKIQNSMSDYVINDITFGSTNYGSVIELNNYYKVKYNEDSGTQTDLRGMLRFELAPYAGVQKDSMIWTEPKLYFYAKLENDEFGDTILGHEDAHWSKAYINEINCYEIKFGGNSIHDILEHIVSLSYVTHYSSTALTSNSTNSLSVIDNQDSVKVNDKVIDSTGKMFYITSVDLRNNEFEVGSVVDTFAKDSAVSTAQATANSAQQTATTARQQSYVFRYSSTALTASSTNSNTLLDNTDNLKVGDKVIDSSGVLFSVTAIDSVNSTFTVGSALVDLALDSNVVHTNEINSSGIGIIGAVKEVGGVDFNTLTTQGLYGANASGSTNNPENSPCVVQVIKRLNSVIQIASVSSAAYKSRYIRYCADITAQPPVWQSWIKFAIDNEVVHKSGDETITGNKRFGVVQSFTGYPSIRLYSSTDDITVLPSGIEQRDIRFTDKNNAIIAYFIFQHRNDANEPFRTCWRQNRLDGTDGYYSVDFNNLGEFYPENNNAIKLGTSLKRWSEVYATNYYYGSNNVEFSTKFVTSDTTQTISGAKTFSNTPFIYNSDTSGSTANLYLRNQLVTKGDTSSSGNQTIRFADVNDKLMGRIQSNKVSNGASSLNLRADTIDTGNNDVTVEVQILAGRDGSKSLSPQNDNAIDLGRTLAKWKNIYSNQINGLTPSSLSLPNYAQRIDIAGYITDLTGGNNIYTPIANGYIYLRTDSGLMLEILDATSGIGSSSIVQSSDKLRIFLPVVAQRNVYIKAKCTSLVSAVFVPCCGNI